MITQCQAWVSGFIAKLGICPFAKPVLERNQLDWQVIEEEALEDQLILLMGHVQSMLAADDPETMLIIVPAYQDYWLDFLTLIEIANELLRDHDLLSNIQIASFHPEYQFEGEPADSASHYTNRSPWPMVHLIRQASISRVLENYQEPEAIPERNIQLMEQLGVTKLQQQLGDLKRQGNN